MQTLISVDILTPAFHFPSTYQKSEIFSLCRANIGTEDLEFIPINSHRIGMVILDSKFNMESIEWVYQQNCSFVTQLQRATESLQVFQERIMKDQQTILELKREVSSLKKIENDLMLKLEEQIELHRESEAKAEEIILDLQHQLLNTINYLKMVQQHSSQHPITVTNYNNHRANDLFRPSRLHLPVLLNSVSFENLKANINQHAAETAAATAATVMSNPNNSNSSSSSNNNNINNTDIDENINIFNEKKQQQQDQQNHHQQQLSSNSKSYDSSDDGDIDVKVNNECINNNNCSNNSSSSNDNSNCNSNSKSYDNSNIPMISINNIIVASSSISSPNLINSSSSSVFTPPSTPKTKCFDLNIAMSAGKTKQRRPIEKEIIKRNEVFKAATEETTTFLLCVGYDGLLMDIRLLGVCCTNEFLLICSIFPFILLCKLYLI
ncbi:hypothetical protein PPL_01184 [Heterostelium album PN500]|uniref:Uncharacterized protein n=1 Tax=Heterostelium pallidum (strain ATCC 26659 / Pp 5 / PN500) TaxID=670386 RepID=D3AYC4_HETP5|nr:hypothetical protein PPL_01184 [Heterostelium album PN500]EFA85951.1 hypothetical protein PPL_01184 [Heterostelium album PN500]|eukprot:XP_020438057.1 hypothetical protein PPL_01184 [Heterostelium album PN500]